MIYLRLGGCVRQALLKSSGTRNVMMKARKAVPPLIETLDEKNERLNRPQSPHLSIYKAQLTSLLSITHRMTGALLAAYVIAFSFGSLVLPKQIPCYIEAYEALCLGKCCVIPLKAIIAFPFTYHFCNGIRHLIWDTAAMLSLPAVYASGYAMLFVALGSAVVLAFCPLDTEEPDECDPDPNLKKEAVALKQGPSVKEVPKIDEKDFKK